MSSTSLQYTARGYNRQRAPSQGPFQACLLALFQIVIFWKRGGTGYSLGFVVCGDAVDPEPEQSTRGILL